MIRRHLFLCTILAVTLTACGDSMRPTYSGHEESTEGVPGFVKGKKVSPHVKLGQSYTVGGKTYVPRHQPDYVEEGMASWYGPGFHGGKTANGERFDASELTAAHRTLPLPSIVRVTMLSTGKYVYVRINDRGPFAHSRIIDLSRAAAEKIGLVRSGVGKVRVEYMEHESERFAELLAQGREPKSIDLASEVIAGDDSDSLRVASRSPSYWDQSSAAAVSHRAISNETNESAPVADVTASDLAPPASAAVPTQTDSPFAALEESSEPVQPSVARPASVLSGKQYVQLGAFSNQANAERLMEKYATIDGLSLIKKTTADGKQLFHVRMGPYSTSEASEQALARVEAAGAEARIVKE